MGVVQETNTFLRTLVYGGIVAIVGFVGWEANQFLRKDEQVLAEKDQKIKELDEQMAADRVRHANELAQQLARIKQLDQELQRSKTALKFLKMDHRVARIEVLDQEPDPQDPKRKITLVKFVEVGANDEPLTKPVMGAIQGEELYIDAQVIRFKDEFVEAGDELRGRSICRFRRLYGEHQRPSEGLSLERMPLSPAESSEFELKLWKEFWELANQSDKAEEVGVRSANGGGPSIVLRKGAQYRVELRSSGDLSIRPEGPPPVAAVRPTP